MCPPRLNITINLYFKGQNTLKNVCVLTFWAVGEWKRARNHCVFANLHVNIAMITYQLVEMV